MSELPRYVLASDPGKRSGVALLDLLTGECTGQEVQSEDYGDHIENLISTYRPSVVCESFIISAATIRNTQAPWSLELIGITRWRAQHYGCSFTLQPPSSAKRFATDDRLKALGWYVKGKGHLADAQRHALLFVAGHGWWDPALDAG